MALAGNEITKIVLCSTLMCLLSVNYSLGGKYSAKNNRKIKDFTLEEHPFRMRKVNLLWDKAKKVS
jgi:hypothetical protein